MKEYKKKKPLTRENTDFDTRHIPIAGGGAPIIALLGGDKEEQVEANWDGWKLTGGALGGAGLGGAAGYGIGNLIDGESDSILGKGLGTAIGALGGGLLGEYITFKTMANNRGVDDTYAARHLPIIGRGATIAALQGYSPEDQVESNWNNLKIKVPQTAARVLGHALLPGFGGAISQGVGSVMYDKLKDNKLKQERDN